MSLNLTVPPTQPPSPSGSTVRYHSTRGQAPELGFCDAVLAGLARDGGLYVPVEWPKFSPEDIAAMAGLPYAEVCKRVLAPFVGDEIAPDALGEMIDEAYQAFGHPAVAPLVQSGPNMFILELFHGPTLAFKDVAMQLLSRMVDHILAGRGERITVVGATSGDTGSAAIEAFRGRDASDIFILFPDGKVSDVQRRQMTTVADANVHCLAVTGDFDDCQALVKAMFNHHAFRDAKNLSGVNSINWGRIMPQIVYYFTSALALGAPNRPVSFCVPTGNFGDIFAAYVAKQMGLPIDRLIIATNSNDILHRTLETGRYEKNAVQATTSPSMDIQVSSNFERLLFLASGRDADYVQRCMSSLAQSGSFELGDEVLTAIRNAFDSGAADESQVAQTIRQSSNQCDYIVDPHTAVGLHVAVYHEGSAPMVVLGTAHPAKFPDAVHSACGTWPDLPRRLKGLMDGEERFTVIENALNAVEGYISEHSRV